MISKMSEENYVKLVLGKWFDPRIKKTVEVYVLTHEMTQTLLTAQILITLTIQHHGTIMLQRIYT